MGHKSQLEDISGGGRYNPYEKHESDAEVFLNQKLRHSASKEASCEGKFSRFFHRLLNPLKTV